MLPVVAFISGDHIRAPAYFTMALKAYQACGGILVERIPAQSPLLISSVSGKDLNLQCPSILLESARSTGSISNPAVDEETWHIHFGLVCATNAQYPHTVLCDAGWPYPIVDELLSKQGIATNDAQSYGNAFEMASFRLL
jgi:hypothetical protein